MSIVIVTKDHFKVEREKTRSQEHHIDKDKAYAKWQMSDVTKPNPIMKILGLAALPILAFWSLLMIGVGFAMTLVVFLLKTLSKIFR